MQYGSAMMKRNAMFAFLALAVASVCPAEDDNSDEKIKRLIVGSNFYIDNPDASYRMFMNARRRCGTDTNRFARLLAEVAQTNNDWVAQDAISSLGVYGTSAQLPFLYSMATNEQHDATAVKSILQLEGVTSNSVASASRYLFSTNYRHRARYEICDSLVSQLAKTQANRSYAERVVLRFLSDYNIYHDWLDAAMKRADPTYSQSKRRLRVLRAISLRETDAKDLSYVTNAINELVAYPEADLPE